MPELRPLALNDAPSASCLRVSDIRTPLSHAVQGVDKSESTTQGPGRAYLVFNSGNGVCRLLLTPPRETMVKFWYSDRAQMVVWSLVGGAGKKRAERSRSFSPAWRRGAR